MPPILAFAFDLEAEVVFPNILQLFFQIPKFDASDLFVHNDHYQTKDPLFQRVLVKTKFSYKVEKAKKSSLAQNLKFVSRKQSITSILYSSIGYPCPTSTPLKGKQKQNLRYLLCHRVKCRIP